MTCLYVHGNETFESKSYNFVIVLIGLLTFVVWKLSPKHNKLYN